MATVVEDILGKISHIESNIALFVNPLSLREVKRKFIVPIVRSIVEDIDYTQDVDRK